MSGPIGPYVPTSNTDRTLRGAASGQGNFQYEVSYPNLGTGGRRFNATGDTDGSATNVPGEDATTGSTSALWQQALVNPSGDPWVVNPVGTATYRFAVSASATVQSATISVVVWTQPSPSSALYRPLARGTSEAQNIPTFGSARHIDLQVNATNQNLLRGGSLLLGVYVDVAIGAVALGGYTVRLSWGDFNFDYSLRAFNFSQRAARQADDAPAAVIDTPQRVTSYVRPPTDAAPAPTDTARRQADVSRFNDAATPPVQDATVRVTTSSRSVADATALGDVTERTTTTFRDVADVGARPTAAASRVATFPRPVSDVVGSPVGDAIRDAVFRRINAQTVDPISDVAARVVTFPRTVSDDDALADTASRTTSTTRSVSDSGARPTPSARRVATFPRRASDVVARPLDTTSRQAVFRRVNPQPVDDVQETSIRAVSTTRLIAEVVGDLASSANKTVTYGRVARYAFQLGDEPVIDPTREIRIRVRDAQGELYGPGASVVLFTQANVAIGTEITDASSEVAWPRNSFDGGTYYVVAHDDGGGALRTQSVSERGLVPVDI